MNIKYVKIFLKILLILSLIVVTMSFILKDVVIKTFSQEILSKKISGYFLDNIIYDVDIDELGEIENNIRNSKITLQITSKFIKTIVENIVYNKNTKMNVEKEIDLLISQNMYKEALVQNSANIRINVEEQINNIEARLEKNLLYSFGDDYIIILRLYNIFTNIYFRVIMILLCIIDIAVLIILEKYNIIKSLKICSLIITIFSVIILVIIKLMSNFIDQNLAGGWLQGINVDSLVVTIVIEAIITFLLFAIQSYKNSKVNKESEMNK